MAVSKRLRYEVLRRDDYTCRYCGGKAPDVTLTVDHVVPVALGGGDLPENLVTACRDCNAGKSAVQPDAPLVVGVSDHALRWAAAMTAAAEAQRADRHAMDAVCAAFYEMWPSVYAIDRNWRRSVENWVAAGMSLEDLEVAIDEALAARGVDWRWKYFCGIVNKRLRERQERAQDTIAEEDAGE